MTNDTFEAMREKAKEDIVEMLKGGYSGYYSDLHNEVFNTCYYIIGRAEAIAELESIGVFAAIDKVQEYERANFGEVITDLSDPEKLVNMLYYVVGDEVMGEHWDAFSEHWDDEADDEANAAIIAAINAE
jgi:hypothetical protein